MTLKELYNQQIKRQTDLALKIYGVKEALRQLVEEKEDVDEQIKKLRKMQEV